MAMQTEMVREMEIESEGDRDSWEKMEIEK